jgi:nucleotide-binding universal stress UspA family protein
VMVCLDSSPRAPQVFATALELARAMNAKLLLMRAVGVPLDLPQELLLKSPSEIPEILEKRALLELDVLSRDVPPSVLSEIVVRIGIPWQAICTAAREKQADLIVMGSHGYSGIDHLIGTTASRVVHHAERSVLIVRPPHHDAVH